MEQQTTASSISLELPSHTVDPIRTSVLEFKSRIKELTKNPAELEAIFYALQVSVDVHIHQEDRADGNPYPLHPIAVAQKVSVIKPFNSTLVVAALLHDTVEDQAPAIAKELNFKDFADDSEKAALHAIHSVFGKRVARIVSYLTNPDYNLMAENAIQQGDSRIKADLKNEFYRKHILHIAKEDHLAFVIKLCDFSDNALHISRVTDSDQYNKLRNKYEPCIKDIIVLLEDWQKKDGFQAQVAELFLEEFKVGYLREYQPK